MSCMPTSLPVCSCAGIWWVWSVWISLAIARFITITSQMAFRPRPSGRLTRAWVITASRLCDRKLFVCSRSSMGSASMMRSTVLVALVVCSVPSTRWPVSAAVIAIEMVSASRISPTRITSGSSRIAARTPSAKLGRCVPSSRWITWLFLLRWTNSMGSSRLTMLRLRVAFSRSIIAASVVDLPVPVEPVTRIIPWWWSHSFLMTGGRARLSRLGTSLGIARNTAPTPVSLRNTLTRKRPPSSLT